MARFINPFPQFISLSGSPINGGFLKFFDTGTSNPKVVFGDPDLTQSIGSVIRLDGSGRIPAIFLSGAYAVTLTDANSNEIDSADPIGLDTDITNFDLWDITNTYNIPDIVRGSDDLYYQSIVDTNLGNDPTSQPSAFWEQFFFLPTWNTAQTYASGQLAIGSDDKSYQSQVGSNTGNDPTTDDGTNWQILLESGSVIDVAGLTISKTGPAAASIIFQSDDSTSWLWDFDGSENMSLDRFIGGVLQDTTLFFANANGNATFMSPVVTLSQDGNATDQDLVLTSDAAESNILFFQDATVNRWTFGQNAANNFSLITLNASGLNPQTVFNVQDGVNDIQFGGNLKFILTNQGLDVSNLNGGALKFNFPDLSLETEDTAFDFFDNTTTTGDKLFNIYQGDGTSTVTFQIDAETGSIHTALDRAGEADVGVKLGKIILSQDAPTGGEDGDLWLRF